MKPFLGMLVLSVAWTALTAPAVAAEAPAWAYPVSPLAPASDAVADLHLEDHPAMPDVVKAGRENVRACASCHLPNGAGRPDNSSLAGLSEGYIKQQVLNFKQGKRIGAEPKRAAHALMNSIAANVTDEDLAAAAKYFASLTYTPFVKVVEAGMVSKTFVTDGMLAKSQEGGTEPIGQRIIEVPEDLQRAESHDSHTPFVAYVPDGSLKRGAEIVGNSQCTSCHGYDMHGSGDVPGLAGRSPSYLLRQLYDIQRGKRSGGVAPMQQVINQFEMDDMIAVAAYIASQK